MNAYSSLARFYDSLTADVPYASFADYYEKLFMLAGLNVKTILDLACGTGSMTCELARRGYEIIGADPSPDMLSVAARKSEDIPVKPIFICQAMETLDLYGTVNAAVCTLDGVNYVRPDVLPEAFRRIKLFLEPGGIFIFDINTPLKLRSLDGEVFLDETDDVFCVWRAELLRDENALLFGMDIFEKKGKLWSRSGEEHVEYLYEPAELLALLKAEGFSDVSLYGGLTFNAPLPEEQRIFIVAR